MAEEAVSEVPMEVVSGNQAEAEDSENGISKRPREEGDDAEESEQKKAKVEEDEKSVEERRIESEEKLEDQKEEKEADEEGKESDPVAIGPKAFGSSVEMFDYFYKLLHTWCPNINLNKYEHVVLLELIKKGHTEAERKIGAGVKHFQVRFHPQFRSRCFFIIREDESVDDFSFRKCVDHILPLPENMQIKHDVNKALRGKGGGGRRQGHGRGRGGGR
ncbi:protein EMBRYO DEFECTIVE 514 [Andrographis paniculata]|uniref:protein EMBRYO DEFECTIVE 514 n=1 Tax=Andrographis paniculata TaxID=175694 RepID=UPI0021E98381|nr:protein EMBRYO DEFECTIVE 514 [Andrographis paniculata]